MNAPFGPPALAEASPPTPLQWREGSKGYGLFITVLVHLLLLAAVLSWRSRAPSPEPRSMDVSLVPAKEQPKPLEAPPVLAPKPELASPGLPPITEPPPVVVDIPQPVPAAQPVAPSPLAAPAPAPTAGVGTAAVAAAAPAASAVGSTRLVEDCADAPDRMMVAEVYRLSPRATSVNEMNRRKPMRTVCLAQLNFAPRNMGLGIAGLDLSEWYGLDIRFTLNVPQDGPRDFMLLSDDGAVLYVDDARVIDNDGLHTPEALMETVNLSKGVHLVRVRYFQGPGDGALMLGWKKPGEADYQPLPRRLLGRPPAAAEQGQR
ncbi:PA14 domain-containing protein [Burkholderiaceae bacterium UC74_6]